MDIPGDIGKPVGLSANIVRSSLDFADAFGGHGFARTFFSRVVQVVVFPLGWDAAASGSSPYLAAAFHFVGFFPLEREVVDEPRLDGSRDQYP